MKEYLARVFKYPKSFKRFILIQLVLGISSGIWFLNMNYFFFEKGFDSSYIGKLNAIGPIVTAIFSLYSGYLCDKFNYKKVFGIGLLLKWASMLLTIIAPVDSLYFIARIIGGISEAMIIISSYPYAISLVDEKDKNTAYSLVFSASMISLFIGNLAGGICTSFVSGTDKYSETLMIGIVISIVANVMLYLLPDINKEIKKEKIAKVAKVALYIPRNSSVLWSLLFNFIGYTQYFLATSMFNIIFRDFFGVKEWVIGFTLGSMFLFGGFVSLIVPWIIEKMGRIRATMYVFLIIFLAYAMMTFSRGGSFVILAILSSLFSVSIVAILEGPILNKIPEGEKGRYLGIKNLLTSIGTSIGIYIAGIFMNIGVSGLFFMYLLVSIFVAIQFIVYYYKFPDYLENKN